MSVKALLQLAAFSSSVLSSSVLPAPVLPYHDNTTQVETPILNYDAEPFTKADADAFDHGEFGYFPEVHFKTTNLTSPRVLKRTWDAVCEDEELFYFYSPYGRANAHPGPMILDHNGQMVWHDESYPRSYGLTVQEYHGEPHLTWWTGDDSIRGHGIGNYYILDSSYRLQRQLGVLNNLPADLHEFKILGNNAIVTSFPERPRNLAQYGKPEDGYIWDSVFQEYNMETNEVVFEWHASEHYDMRDCYDLDKSLPKKIGEQDRPWDWFHINSVDKDDKGNYLVSARYCAISYICGKTGAVLWRLGGYNSSFSEPDGEAADFAFQHHARWDSDYKYITLFDNRATDLYGHDKPSRGLKLGVDQHQMIVWKEMEYIHPQQWIGESQGSMQRLDNGHYVIGWGHDAAITQFYPDGTVACDIQFAAIHYEKDGVNHGGKGQSYRVFKQKWVGKPHYNPKTFFDQSYMYVSWNGATEVRKWRLEGSVDRETWTLLADTHKTGFETRINILPNTTAYFIYRLTAIDKQEQSLGQWTTFVTGTVQAVAQPQTSTKLQLPQTRSFMAVFAAFLAGGVSSILTVHCWKRRIRRRGSDLFREKFANEWMNKEEAKLSRQALLHDSESELESR